MTTQTRSFKNSKILFLISALALFSFYAIPTNTTYAAGQEYSGWLSFPDTENLGDTGACAPGEDYLNFITKDYNTETTITPSRIGIYYYRSGSLLTSVGGAAMSETPSVCFNPTTDSIKVFVEGDGSYSDFGLTANVDLSTTFPVGKKLRSHIHLKHLSVTPTHDLVNIAPISTASTSLTWINTDPTYQVAVQSFPSIHNATNVVKIVGTTYDQSGNIVQNWAIPGGDGLKTYSYKPPTPLPNGIYQWHAATFLNEIPAGRPISTLPMLYSFPNPPAFVTELFGVDKTLPEGVFTVSPPASVATSDLIRITASGSDTLSGLAKLSIYVDGVLSTSTTLTGTSTAQISITPITFPLGAHTYYVESKDRAGNTYTSSTKTFTVYTFVNGSCSTYHYSCITGISANNISSAGAWTWDCLGTGVGALNASCVQLKTNPQPVVTFNGPTTTINLGDSVLYSGSATDASSDIDTFSINWKNPDGTFNWTKPGGSYQATLSVGPTVTYATLTNNAFLTTIMTPTSIGTYSVYFVAHDPNGYLSSTKYNLVVNPPLDISGSATGTSYTIGTGTNGSCGLLNGTTTPTTPSGSDLCASTSVTPTVSGSGHPWSWTCYGSNGGLDSPLCTATKSTFTCGDNACEKSLGETPLLCPTDCKFQYKNI